MLLVACIFPGRRRLSWMAVVIAVPRMASRAHGVSGSLTAFGGCNRRRPTVAIVALFRGVSLAGSNAVSGFSAVATASFRYAVVAAGGGRHRCPDLDDVRQRRPEEWHFRVAAGGGFRRRFGGPGADGAVLRSAGVGGDSAGGELARLDPGCQSGGFRARGNHQHRVFRGSDRGAVAGASRGGQ